MTLVQNALVLAVALATPLALAALGELVAERAGVLNLGLEGMMLMGGATAFVVSIATHSLVLATLAGVLAGASVALLHAFVTIGFGVNQVVSGLTLTLLGGGVASVIGARYAGAPVGVTVNSLEVPLLSSVSMIGPSFFDQDVLVYVMYGLLVATGWFLSRTRLGMWTVATGEAPAAADAVGIPVTAVRVAAVTFGGLMAGLAGAYFSVVYARAWTDNLTAGRGWIALALVILASWRVKWVLPAAVLFGFIDGLAFQLQGQGVPISADLLGMLPYVVSLVALLVLWMRTDRSAGVVPAALGQAFQREQRGQ